MFPKFGTLCVGYMKVICQLLQEIKETQRKNRFALLSESSFAIVAHESIWVHLKEQSIFLCVFIIPILSTLPRWQPLILSSQSVFL